MVGLITSICYIMSSLNRIMTKNVDNIPLVAGKSKMFSIGCLKFLDSYNFFTMPLDQMAKIYGCKIKTLNPYEYFGLDSYNEVIGNLKMEDFKSSLSLSLMKYQHKKKLIYLIKRTVIQLVKK